MNEEVNHIGIYTGIDELDVYYDNEDAEDDLLKSCDAAGTAGVDVPAAEKVPGLCNLEEGFWKTREKYGYINLKYWAKMTGYKMDEILHLANGIYIWQDPVRYQLSGDRYSGWITREEMLTGNLVEKYHKTEKYHEQTGLYEENLKLLKANLPEEVLGDELYIGMGVTWLRDITLEGVGIYASFVSFLLETKDVPDVSYEDYTGKWKVLCDRKPAHILNEVIYGTSKMSAVKIIEHLLNLKPIKIKDPVMKPDGSGVSYVLNKTETFAAQKKAELIEAKWHEWVKGYMPEIIKAYMEHFGYSIPSYDGHWIEFPDSPKCRLKDYQKNAAAQIISCKNVLLADEVGSGKTYEYCAGVHKLIQMQLSKKALITVPNDTVKAVYDLYTDLFPNDKVLCCYPNGNFKSSHRKKTLEKIQNGDYEVIFMPHSSLDRLTLSKEYLRKKKRAELRNLQAYIEQVHVYEYRQQLRRVYTAMKHKTDKWEREYKDTYQTCFDDLGFDLLVVDEAHHYKNISINHFCGSEVIGLHTEGSKKADNMLDRVRYIEKTGGRVIFATGTPITNSMTDIYTWQYYLQPQELRESQTYYFHAWLATFTKAVCEFEVDVDAQHYRMRTRYSSFQNLPELMKMFASVAHFHKADHEDRQEGLPEFEAYKDIVVKKTEEQKKYIEELVRRTEDVRAGRVDPAEDNLLKITLDGKKIALDERLVRADRTTDQMAEQTMPDTKEEKTGKDAEHTNRVSACAENVRMMYQKHPGFTQAVFLDISTPKAGFNLYDELKRILVVDKGIPVGEIRFIQEADTAAKRKKMEKDFNAGKIRILIGSTTKLGTGCNIQERLVAVHHLDIPWRPADFVQRNGRILRQGNQCKRVEIFRYITEGSFDAYLYQLIEKKQIAISQFLEGSALLRREEEDCSNLVLEYGEIKALALGNPMIKRRVEVHNVLGRTRMNQRARRKELLKLQEVKAAAPEQIETRKERIRQIEEDIRRYQNEKEVIPREERMAFGEELLAEIRRNLIHKERVFDIYQGFQVVLPDYMERDKPFVYLQSSGRYKVNMKDAKALGCSQRLDHVLENLAEEREQALLALQAKEDELVHAREELAKGNPYDKTVEALEQKLARIDEMLEKEGTAV